MLDSDWHSSFRYFLILNVNGNTVCQNLVSHHIVLKNFEQKLQYLWLEELKSTRGEILIMFTLPMSVDD